MIEDFAAIRAAIDLFMPRLDALAKCGEDMAAIEDILQSCVGQLAHDLGLRRINMQAGRPRPSQSLGIIGVIAQGSSTCLRVQG